jgi:hypothetical protein
LNRLFKIRGGGLMIMKGINDNSGGFDDCLDCIYGPTLCERVDLLDGECRNFEADGTFIVEGGADID